MRGFLDSGGLRVVGYVVAAAAAVLAVAPERRRDPADALPGLWLAVAAALMALGGARVLHLGEVLADAGRDRAESGGWYDVRGPVQFLAVAAIGALWLAVIAVLWLLPRYRRFLPTAVVLSGLAGFAAVRIVSFHFVDAALYRRDVAGVRVVAWAELGLLAAMILTASWAPRQPAPRKPPPLPG